VIVVLAIEEVVSEVGVPLHEAGPTLFGRRLYTTLHNAGESVVMLSSDTNRSLVQEWLLREGFADYVKLLTRDDPTMDQAVWKIQSVHGLVSAGHHISYMVDKDPRVLAKVSEMGVPTLLALHAMDSPGRLHDGDMAYESWDTLVGSIEAESLRRAEQRRRARESGD
jgi:hypothetical protein